MHAQKKLSRLAFVTIGQTPSLIVEEMAAQIGAAHPDRKIEIGVFGALDGLDGEALDAMRAKEGEISFSAGLRTKEEIVISRARTEARLEQMLPKIDGQNFDLIVLLCTGTYLEAKISTLMVEAQKIVDKTIESLAASAENIGMILPLERQLDDFATQHDFAFAPKLVAVSPYSDAGLARKLEPLSNCDLVVMHCMGYGHEMWGKVRAILPCPVLLARKLVSNIVIQLV